MRKWAALGIVALLLAIWSAILGEKIAGASGSILILQFRLDESNSEIEALTKRVKELEDAKDLDERRVAEIEARISK